MQKIIFRPNQSRWQEVNETKARITIQLRAYDDNGNYDKSIEGKSNQTIHLKDVSLARAYELIKCAMMSSNLFNQRFEIEE